MQQAQLVAQRCQAGRRFAATQAGKEFGRLRLENDGRALQAACGGLAFETLQDVAVAEVHAVEVADGNGCGRGVLHRRAAKEDFHRVAARKKAAIVNGFGGCLQYGGECGGN